MVVTVQQSIPTNARGFFLRERDTLNDQFGVQLKFPKGREFMYGNSQTMLMIGLQSKINKMMPQVRRILEEAHEQYLGFKERRAARKANEKFFTKAPEAKVTKDVVPKKKQNPFAALEGLFEQEQEQQIQKVKVLNAKQKAKLEAKELNAREEQAIHDGKAPKPMKTTKTTMNFAAAAAKPKLEEPKQDLPVVEKPNVKLIIKKHFTGNKKPKTLSWAEMADSCSDDDVVEDEGNTWNNIDFAAM
jgi:hypothetical protein